MAKMQGLWRPRPKIDEAEFEAAKTRTAARLADLFGVDAQPSDGDVPATEAPDEAADAGTQTEADSDLETEAFVLPLWPGGPRPAIVVEAQPDLVGVMAEPGRAEREPVGVMARPEQAAAVAAPGAAVPGARSSHRRKMPAGASESRGVDADARDDRPGGVRAERPAARPKKGQGKATPVPAPAAASCPYCAVLLQPPPSSSQRCARCRQRIVVRRVEARAVYLTEAAVQVFEAERRRIAGAGRLTRERDRWLKLAAAAGAPSARAARLAAAQLSGDTVDGARTLYVTTVERSFQAAKREHRWEDASRIRREHALAFYRAAGSPVPVPAEIIGLHRDGVAAELRGIAEVAREAELVSASCCDACRADDGGILRIATELRLRRLPHDGCPKGLCRCGWDLPAAYRTTIQRYLRRRTRADHRAGPGDHSPTA